MAPHHPTIPPAAQPIRKTFDPWNSASTGHQRAENRLSGSTSWRDSRSRKLQHQFGDVSSSGGQRLFDTVGAGSLGFGRDGRKESGGWEIGAKGLRPDGWRDVGLMLTKGAKAEEAVRRREREEEERLASMDGRVFLVGAQRLESIAGEEEEEEKGEGGDFTSREIPEKCEMTRTANLVEATNHCPSIEPHVAIARQAARINAKFTESKSHVGILRKGASGVEKASSVPHHAKSKLASQTALELLSATCDGFADDMPPPSAQIPLVPDSKTHSKPGSITSNVASCILSSDHETQPSLLANPNIQNPIPKIFRGLTIYINGSTYPLISDHKLKRLLLGHGAQLSISLGRKSVTHVIIGRPCLLPPSSSSPSPLHYSSTNTLKKGAGGGLSAKKHDYEIHRKISATGSVRYVTVDWALESIKAGKRLAEWRFEEGGMRTAPCGVGSLVAFGFGGGGVGRDKH